MKNVKNNKGITLMALVITIILLIILASIGIYSGRQVVKSAQFTAFSTELKIMQTQVNSLYEKKKNNEKILLNNVETDIEDIGTAISSSSEVQTQANKAFIASGITDSTDYKYFDTDTIKSLNIEGVEGEFLVNIDKRSVVSYDGFEYEGKTYYTLEQLPDGLYNVDYNTSEEQPDFDVDYDFLENGKCKITVNNINYIGNINKWQVKYKKENEEDWKQSNNYSFIIDELGNYRVKIANNNTESREKQIKAKSLFLPSEYQEVEYIESTGTQYIDTGIIPSFHTLTADFQCMNTQNSAIFGTWNGWQQVGYYFLLYSSKWCYQCGTTQIYGNAGDTNRHVLIFNNDEGKMVLDDQTISLQMANITGVQDSVILFTNITSGTIREYNLSKIRIYSLKIYDKSQGKLVRSFVPCKSVEGVTNTIGLFDIVNNEFYTNQGTGDFEKGNDIDSGKRIEQIIINDM